MERIALLIEASDVAGQQDLPGARKDVNNWRKFLCSDLGGRWDKDEIKVMNKPQSLYLQTMLNSYRDRYCFVAFSGHGYHDRYTNHTKICLNDSEKDCDVINLRPQGAKGTLLIDACRGVDLETDAFFESRMAKSTDSINFNFSQTIDHPSKLWFDNLRKSNVGILSMYSCSVGEEAGEFDDDNPSNGGYYTSILISSAKIWSGNVMSNSCYTTLMAHEDTARYMARRFPQQNPQYDPSYIKFPFAVKV